MSSLPDLTAVVAVDEKTLPQIQVSSWTWARHRPHLFARPWIVIYDRRAFSGLELRQALCSTPLADAKVNALPWPPKEPVGGYASQRERMLTGFVYAPLRVDTAWWMKIDTDALALEYRETSSWAPPDWFQPQPTSSPATNGLYDHRYHAWIASPWGYTKPANQMDQLDTWGDHVPGLQEHPRLDLPFDRDGRRCRHPRMASWVSFYRTDWSCFAARLAWDSVGPWRIPVPSQDGYHFYVAQRRGDNYLRANQKRRGWTNCPRFANLQQRAAEVLPPLDSSNAR